MRRADLTGWAPWMFCATVLGIAALTLARPESAYAFIVVPVIVCSVLGARCSAGLR